MGVRFCAGIRDATTSTGLAGGGPGKGGGGGWVGPKSGSKLVTWLKLAGKRGLKLGTNEMKRGSMRRKVSECRHFNHNHRKKPRKRKV